MKNNSVKSMIERFLENKNNIMKEEIEVLKFGNTDGMADKLGDLVLSGKKIGTSSDYMLYNNEDELPKINTYSLITNSKDEALCIIKTLNVEIIDFNKATKEHAFKEGEGDLSHKYWYDVHRKFFKKEREKKGLKFTEDMKIVFETFEVVFR